MREFSTCNVPFCKHLNCVVYVSEQVETSPSSVRAFLDSKATWILCCRLNMT